MLFVYTVIFREALMSVSLLGCSYEATDLSKKKLAIPLFMERVVVLQLAGNLIT